MVYDVVIIGAGIVGALTARELSRYELKICLLEKEADAGTVTSSANSGIIHAGYDAEPGSLKARFNLRGNEMMGRTAKELGVPFKRTGSLVLAFHEADMRIIRELYFRGMMNGVPGLEILTKEQVGMMEPNVSRSITGALYAPSAGVICPYELTAGAVENAVSNGVELKLECEVLGIEQAGRHLADVEPDSKAASISANSTGMAGRAGRKARTDNTDVEGNAGGIDGIGGTGFILKTGRGDIRARYVVNVAGLYADKVSIMAGAESFAIRPRKGEYLLLDRNIAGIVKRVIFQPPTSKGKGILVIPTVEGNILIGPNASDVEDKDDFATSAGGLDEVIRGALKSVPGMCVRDIITSFAGLRATPSTGDFIIEESGKVKGFVNVAGIESPGLTASPAIAEHVVEILRKAGLRLAVKDGFNPVRPAVYRFREMDDVARNHIISMNPMYGRVVCRCESVTEGEVVDCFRRSAGARDLDGVKRRTRAGMGRCQGGFCTPRVMEILSRELGIPMEEVTKSGGRSRLLAGRTK